MAQNAEHSTPNFDYKFDDPILPEWTAEQQKALGFDATTEGLTFMQRKRLQERINWSKYWEMRYKESEGSIFARFFCNLSYAIDVPTTWFREKIVEPLNDRNRLPYYHRRFDRVPDIDLCGNQDKVCIWEANEQYRIDKQVDSQILALLRNRVGMCLQYWDADHWWKCAKTYEDHLESDLNFFIKYGELGTTADVVDSYMKQKHRLIWERRHPEIMAERKRRVEEHKQAMREGKFDIRFWSRFAPFTNKQQMAPATFFGHDWKMDRFSFEGDQSISKDWRYYKKLYEDPDFDVRNYPVWLNEANRKAKELEDARRMAGQQ